jgi:hypothetical protein
VTRKHARRDVAKGLTGGAYKTVTGNVRFSSQTDLWATPQWLYDKLDTESRNFISRLICAPRLLPSVDCGDSDAEFLFSYDAC